jgi:hypothetical protein
MYCQIRRNLSVHVLNLRRTCLKTCRHDSTSSKFPPSKCSIVNILKRTLKRISTQEASFQNPCTVSAIGRSFRLRCSHFYLERLCSAISVPFRSVLLCLCFILQGINWDNMKRKEVFPPYLPPLDDNVDVDTDEHPVKVESSHQSSVAQSPESDHIFKVRKNTLSEVLVCGA